MIQIGENRLEIVMGTYKLYTGSETDVNPSSTDDADHVNPESLYVAVSC